MKEMRNFIVLLFFVVVLSSFVMHKFYVSVTQVDFDEKKERVEITTRIFIDDLDKALEKRIGKKIYLASDREIPEAKEIIEKYLGEKLLVKINGTTVKVQFLGSEIDNDVLICYLKVYCNQKIVTFEFQNSVLTEMFSEQQNLLHIHINDKKESFLLTREEKTALLKLKN